MAGVATEITLDLGPAAAAIARLTDQDLHGLVYGISQLVAERTKERIATGKHAPDGTPWPAWSADYAATRHQGQSLLVGLGNPGLLESIQNYATGLEAVVGTPLVYGVIHQFGGAGAGKPGLPARPYLGLSKDDREAIEALVVDSLGEMLK